MSAPDTQLGFDALLSDADSDNRARRIEQQTAHLPGKMDEALPFYRALIQQHHDAMLAAEVDEVMRLRREADLLAIRLNSGDTGILSHDHAPARVLERESAAAPGAVPLWGQTGEFAIDVDGMTVRIELEGIFGIGSGFSFWPGFAAHAVHWDKPFLSPTGYRSFLGIHADPQPGLTPDGFTREIIAAYIARELKGRPVEIAAEYRERALLRAQE